MRTGKGVEHFKAKLSRAGNFKARTGCVTCKRRRIKCDEAKPQCLNCIKHRGSCEGYTLPPTQRKATNDGQLCLDLRQPPRIAHQPTKTLYTLSPALGNSHTNDYFSEFIRLIQGPWISMQCNDGLWKTTLPQLAHSNSTLRYVATGIGALCFWHSQSSHGTLRATSTPASPGAEEDTHYFHAVAFYCHALRLQSQQNSVADAICLSVLLLTFEALRGNRRAALDHVNHGLAVIVATLTDESLYSHVARQIQHPAILLREVANVLAPLGIQARSILRGRIGESVSLPNFSRGLKTCHKTMDSFMALANDIPPSSIGALHIPRAFHSLHEAEVLCEAVSQRQTALESVLQEAVQASGLLNATHDEDFERSWLAFSKNAHVQSFCEETKDLTQALDSAFIPLFHTIITSEPTSPMYLRAIQLRLHYFGIYVFDNSLNYFDLETLHSQTPLFREYLSLADLYLSAAKLYRKSPAQQLSFRCDLAWRLFSVAMFCRDPVVREDALWKLRYYPACDGLWNTHALCTLALRNKHVEYQNAIEGSHLAQWQRLWRREFVFEDGGDRITFRYLEKDDASGRWQMVEEVAQLAQHLDEVCWNRQATESSRASLMADLVPR